MFNFPATKLFNYKSAILEHLFSISAAIISRCSMLLITLVNTQMMPAEEFGTFVILLLIANLVTTLVSCGGDLWLNRFSRPRHLIKNRAPIVSRLYLQISAGIASGIMLAALHFGLFNQQAFNNTGVSIAWCFAWGATIGIVETILAVLRTTHAIQRFFLIRDFFMPIALIISIVIFEVHTVEKFFMIAFIIGAITLGLLTKLIFSKRHHYFPPLDGLRWYGGLFRKAIMAHTLGLISNNLLARLANGQDALLLARAESMVLVGKYRFVTHFAYAFNMIQHFVFLAFPWQLRKGNKNNVYLKGIQAVDLRQLLLIMSACPALILLIIIARPLLTTLGSGFEHMTVTFSMCLIIRFSELLWGPQHEILISNKKVMWDTLANGIAIVVGVFVFFVSLLYWKNGIASGLFSLGFSSIAGQLSRYLILKKCNLIDAKHFHLTPWSPILIILANMCYLIMREIEK